MTASADDGPDPADQGVRRSHEICVVHCMEPRPSMLHACQAKTPVTSWIDLLALLGAPG